MKDFDEVKRLLIAVSFQLGVLSENKKLDLDTSIYLEHLSHDAYRMCNDLKQIQQSYGV